MCGITGCFSLRKDCRIVENGILDDMMKEIRHRGPDESGKFIDHNIALGHQRLSIIDLSSGQQPLCNEDGTIQVIFNGEIYNYIELREMLINKGHSFKTKSDTEVIPHLYEEFGKDFPNHMNGNFSIALWDSNREKLFLLRDRVGIRPLFYAHKDGYLIFGSEMKSIFKFPGISGELDPVGLEQIFTIWSNIPPQTPFKDIKELAPGSIMECSSDGETTEKYWRYNFPDKDDYDIKSSEFYKQKVKEELHKAVELRLRSDVPVASYLSGGIDSSVVAALVKKHHNNNLITFSVAFKDNDFDESSYQKEMVDYLGTDHRMVYADYNSIGAKFSDVVRYAERPTIRTAPSPLLILSGLVRENGIKVVLTGEGADEVFGGYNIFREDKVRRFWARQPDSKIRPNLLAKLYPYVARSNNAFWQGFFKKGLTDVDDPYYSHRIRWNNTSWLLRYFADDFSNKFDAQKNVYGPLEDYLDKDMGRWHPFCKAQYLEMSLFMSGYLLNTQGDRMMMGNSVEGRFPFLDHNVIEFASTIPPEFKCKILEEKYLIKNSFTDYVPDRIAKRPKQPYRAPIAKCFLSKDVDNLSASMLEEKTVEDFGIFKKQGVDLLKKKFDKDDGASLSEKDNMAVAAIISTQLLNHYFGKKKGEKINVKRV